MGVAITEQTVSLPQPGILTIRLRRRASSEPVSGTISAQRLLHPPPPKAFRAFEEAQRESETGHPLEAVRKLEQAVRLYPDYSEARSNLGILYARLGRNEEALQQFERAVATGPASAPLYGNFSYSLYVAGRLNEAEDAARSALNLDSSFSQAHYLLGSLLAHGKDTVEAIRHLRLGVGVTPKAHMELARLYAARRDRAAAMEEVRLYLNSGDAAYRADAERWLALIAGP
jgi:tetratricopeptide (TPR) repeat protein